MEQLLYYRTRAIDGLSILYREASPPDAPTLLLLHGLPSSSRMFTPLITWLVDRYHLVAPDYPGFGHRDWPEPQHFAYTFDHLAAILTPFSDALGLVRSTLYCRMTVAPWDSARRWPIPSGSRRSSSGRRGARRGLGDELAGAAGLFGASCGEPRRAAR